VAQESRRCSQAGRIANPHRGALAQAPHLEDQMRHFNRLDLDYRLDLIAGIVGFFALPLVASTIASIF